MTDLDTVRASADRAALIEQSMRRLVAKAAPAATAAVLAKMSAHDQADWLQANVRARDPLAPPPPPDVQPDAADAAARALRRAEAAQILGTSEHFRPNG